MTRSGSGTSITAPKGGRSLSPIIVPAPVPPVCEMLTSQQVCDALKISARKLTDEVAKGRIGHVRLGRLLRFRVADVLAYIEAHRSGGPAEDRGC